MMEEISGDERESVVSIKEVYAYINRITQDNIMSKPLILRLMGVCNPFLKAIDFWTFLGTVDPQQAHLGLMLKGFIIELLKCHHKRQEKELKELHTGTALTTPAWVVLVGNRIQIMKS